MKRRTFFGVIGAVLGAACGVNAFPRIITAEWCRKHGSIRLYDATGENIAMTTVWADTKTGKVVQFATDAKGGYILTPDRTELAKVTRYVPAPLRALWSSQPLGPSSLLVSLHGLWSR